MKYLMMMLIALLFFGFIPAQHLSLEEKVGQLLMVHFHGEEANEDAKTLIQSIKVGGIIYYNWANGLTSPEQVRKLSAGLQLLATENQIPLLIAVDQEGGAVVRLKEGFTAFPSNRTIAMSGDPTLAEAAALTMGQELRDVGVNLNLAPVVDVTRNREESVMVSRSFGEDPGIVVAFGEAVLKGYKEAQVFATLKHFPGYGNVIIDPHEDLPFVSKSLEELERVDLLPFAKLAPVADLIMTAHILVPALDKENCATLSRSTLNYLKEKIGFQGVVISDSLAMEGVLKKCRSIDEAAIQALNAGCDILILGGRQLSGEHNGFELTPDDVRRIHHSLVEAVKSGRISEARLNEAVEKICKLKNLSHYSRI